MNPERWEKVAELFQLAVGRAREERDAFLDETCAGDHSLRREVEALLASDRGEEDGFEEIVSGVAARLIAEDGDPELIGKTFGHYQILALLGSGGMGEVYLAQDTTLDRKVALKLLPRQFTQDRDRLRRFEQEARAASALNHPNIITIYEIGDWDGTRFIATEYVEGETLREQIQKPGRTLSSVLDIGIQASGALAAAHLAGIVHRDIKPANIMFRKDGYIKVVDFGLAKLVGPRANLDVTEPGRVMGTINYMSPEQAMGQPLDHRTDIFSLGVVLYELATGRRLFEGKSEAAVYDSILHQNVPAVREFAPAMPEEFEHVVQRALAKDPAQRYQTAADLGADLRRLQQGTGRTEAARIAAHEQSATWRAGVFRVVLGATVVLLLAAALFFGGRRTAELPNARKSIAVLPLQNLSPNADDAYFVDGMQEEILSRLSRITELKVISRASTQRYKNAPPKVSEIGSQLGVAHLLQGSVQKRDDQVSVNLQLVDAKSGQVLWTEKSDRPVAEVFALESAIAHRIAETLHARLTVREVQEVAARFTESSAAHQLYLRGNFLSARRTKQDLEKAIDYYYQAVAQDPNYALAYAGIANAYVLLPEWSDEPAENSLAQARTAVEKAIALDETVAEAHIASALIAQKEFDVPRTRKELQRAVELSPRSSTAHYYLGLLGYAPTGQFKEALTELNRAHELDPFSMILNVNLGYYYILARRYGEAVTTLHKAAELEPNFPYLALMTAHALELNGNLPEALVITEKALETNHDQRSLLVLAELHAKKGEREKALDLVKAAQASRQLGRDWAFGYVLAYLALGDKEQALAALERSYRAKERPAYFMQVDPLLDALRDDPRFEAIRQKVFSVGH